MSAKYQTPGTVKLVNGKATIRYTRKTTTPTQSTVVDCVISEPINLSNRVGGTSTEVFSMTSRIIGKDVVYDISSNNLNSSEESTYNITESTIFDNKFRVSTTILNNEVVYNVTSFDSSLNTDIPYRVLESSVAPLILPPATGESFTIRSVKSNDVVTFTINSSITTSGCTLSVTIDEITGADTILNTITKDVTLLYGIGEITYVLTVPEPTVQNKVVAKLNISPSRSATRIIPKYVAPPILPQTYAGRLIVTGHVVDATLKTITGTVTLFTDAPGPIPIKLSGSNGYDERYMYPNCKTRVSPDVITLSNGESYTYAGTYQLSSDTSYNEGHAVVYADAIGYRDIIFGSTVFETKR